MLARHPEVVKKAQAEINQKIGRERLPTSSDRKNLPYIECIMKEVIRYDVELAFKLGVGSLKRLSV